MPDFSTLSGSQVLLALLVVLLSAGVTVLGHWFTGRQAARTEVTADRNRAFEMLRWATDLAADSDARRSAAGAAALRVLAAGGSVDDVARLAAKEVSVSLAHGTDRPSSAA